MAAAATTFIFLFFIYFLAGTGERKKEKGKGSFETYSKISTRHECNTQAFSRSNSSSNLRSLWQQQHHTSSNNSRTSKVQEICCFQHEATGNRVFLELKCKARKK